MTPDTVFTLFDSYVRAVVNALAGIVPLFPVSFAFAAGMAATINPCGFIMLPSFALFYLGTADREGRHARRLWRAVQMGILVTLAFVCTFAIFGLTVAVIGRQLIGWTYWAGLAIGVLMVGFAGYQLVSGQVVFANITSGVRVSRSRTARGAFTFGVAYAVVSLGCTLPIFMLTLGGVFTGKGDYLTSLLRFVEYGAGMGFVLVILTVGVALARQQVITTVGAIQSHIHFVANLALVFTGAYVIWYWWKALT